MLCGTSGRTPPRRPALFVGRLLTLVLLLVLALAVSAGPASAGPCAPTSAAKSPRVATATGARTLAVRVPESGPKECEPSSPFKKRGNADPISFAFFIGIIAAVVLVPVALGRREDLPPE